MKFLPLVITNCSFIANRAPDQFVKYARSQLVPNGNWRGQGHGGGLDIIFTGLSNRINVTILNCTFANNTVKWGGGLHINFSGLSNSINVTILNCTFTNNTAKWGGGLDIIFTGLSNRNVTILNCTFINNTVKWGGGLDIIFTGLSNRINVTILNCTFANNTAKWGGGTYTHFQRSASNNTVLVCNTQFDNNKAYSEGGGISIGFLQVSSSHNQIVFMNCSFLSNSADTGGGTSLFAVHVHVKPIAGKEILFQNCTWSKNMARSSAAVDIGPSHDDRLSQGFLFIPIFENCTFLNNNLYKWKETVDNLTYIRPNTTTTTTQYSGVFTVTKTTTVFNGSTIFIGNGFTALHATLSRLVFERRSKVKFHDNYGSKGAAIAMYGFSSLVFNSDSSFEFKTIPLQVLVVQCIMKLLTTLIFVMLGNAS